MKNKQGGRQLDILGGSLLKGLLLFAIPLAASSILQQLFNAIDIAVVGKFATSQDQAAVGCNSSVINLLVNLFVGLSVGTNVVVATLIGQNNKKRISSAVHTSMLIAVISGVVLTIVGLFVARPILILMKTPPDTLELAVTYLQIYFVGMPFIMIFNFGSAILRSKGDTKRPLYCLIIAGVINAGLNLLFVIVFHMGVAGVGIATVISNVVSAGIVLFLLFREEEPIRLTLKGLKISKPELLRILKIGIPSGIQGTVFSFTNVFIQAALNGLGSDAVAGSAVTMNYEYMTYFVINAFSQAAVTYISQNYGAGNIDRCKKTFRLCMLCSCLFTAVFSWIIVMNSGFFSTLFSDKPVVIAFAEQRMWIILTVNFIASSYEIAGAALRGLGYSMTPAVLTVFGTCALRLVWIYTVFQSYKSFDVILYVYPLSWALTGVAMLTAYLVVTRRVYRTQTTES